MSNVESKEEREEEKVNNVVAFISRVRFKPNFQDSGESSDEDLSGEDVSRAYKILYLNWKDECSSGEKQKAKINVLLQYKTNLITTITDLKKEIKHLK